MLNEYGMYNWCGSLKNINANMYKHLDGRINFSFTFHYKTKMMCKIMF